MTEPVPASLTPVIEAHRPTTPVQCACGWRETDLGAGSWVEHMVAVAQAVIAEPDNHHNAALCAYCTPRTPPEPLINTPEGPRPRRPLGQAPWIVGPERVT